MRKLKLTSEEFLSGLLIMRRWGVKNLLEFSNSQLSQSVSFLEMNTKLLSLRVIALAVSF
jgi:hypothetical protein